MGNSEVQTFHQIWLGNVPIFVFGFCLCAAIGTDVNEFIQWPSHRSHAPMVHGQIPIPLAYHLSDVENLCRILVPDGTLT